MHPSQQVETFPDGIVEIYTETNRTIGEKKATLRFERQSVGVKRYYESQVSVAGNRIDRVIKVPHTKLAARNDIAVMVTEDNAQYSIIRIQEKPERNVDLWELQNVQVKFRSAENESDPVQG